VAQRVTQGRPWPTVGPRPHRNGRFRQAVVLVGHDWGGALAFDWASRNPARIRGIAFLETIIRPMDWADFPERARPLFESIRTDGVGETMVLDDNMFIQQGLPTGVRSGLSEADLAAYSAPYPTRESRMPLLAWPRELPIGGEPADFVARVRNYDQWLAGSADVPKLLLTFEGFGLMVGPAMTQWCRDNVSALEVTACGPAGHHAPEDQPGAIADAIAAWADRHQLRAE
jgi:haloalkane dehalogenase